MLSIFSTMMITQKSAGLGLILALFCSSFAALAAETETQHSPSIAVNTAAIPTLRTNRQDDVRRKLERFAGKPSAIVFDGDSIMNRWETTGKAIWNRRFAGIAADFGIEGDRVEHVLWRLEHGQVDGIDPKVVVLMIGTNNSGQNSATEIADGIKILVAEYEKRCPHAHIIHMGVFPRGQNATDGGRRKVAAVNEQIKSLADDQRVTFIDISAQLLEPDGSISRDMMPDFVHPTAKGYEIWADAIQPVLNKYLPVSLLEQLPAGATKLLDQPYVPGAKPGTNPASVQTLDLFVPAGSGPFPLIIWIHGGGWHGGDKESSGASLATQFVPTGFALASLDYRYTYDAPFPAQIEDCNAALDWLRRNATAYHLDFDHIGVVGHSAGAHLAALLAVTSGTGKFSTASGPSVRVQAAVCWATPCDLDRQRGNWPTNMFVWNPRDPFCKTFFPGGAYDQKVAREASPASYIHAGAPPMLIVHGAKDTVVPLDQASAFAAKLKAAGADVTFRIDPNHGHDVMGAAATKDAIAFFERTLALSTTKKN